MAASSLLDVCRYNPTAGGTTDWTYSSAVTGYQSPSAAGIVNGAQYSYRAESADLSQWEVGTGTYNTGTGVLSRTTVLFNSSGTTSKINFTVAPQIAIVALAEDLLSFNGTNNFTTTQQAQARSNIGAAGSGFLNRLRNSSLTSWFHGSGALTITTSGGWGAEGIYIVPSGASVTASRAAAFTGCPTFYSQQITGNTGATDVTVRFVIESYDAAPLAGQQVTFQVPILNNTGASITPTITVKRATTGQDNYTSNNGDVSAVSLQTIANGATGVLAYSWLANGSSGQGLSIDIDFGNSLNGGATSLKIGGGFDCRVTPGISTGTVANPPAPEIRTAADDILWNKRFYRASYENGTGPGTATHNGMVNCGMNDATGTGAASVSFDVPMRAAPSLSYWDGAGNASKISYLTANTSTWNDNTTTGVAPFGASTAGFFASGPNSVGHVEGFIHYTADATLTGA